MLRLKLKIDNLLYMSLLMGVIFNLIWLPKAQAATDCTVQSDVPQTECETLLVLYNNTNGEAWLGGKGNPWNLTKNLCKWEGITCTEERVTGIALPNKNLVGELPDLEALTNLQTLNLANNQLSGIIPDLSALTSLQTLFLENNQLSGFIPDFETFSNLSAIKVRDIQVNIEASSSTFYNRLMEVNLDYNKLAALEPELLFSQLILETQTIAPSPVVATASSTSEVEVQWAPVRYMGDGGYYQIKYATNEEGPYTSAKTPTVDKKANRYVVDNLSSDTLYYFVVETHTPAHGDQQNALTSELSEPVSVTTPALGPKFSSEPAPNSILEMVSSDLGNPSTTNTAILTAIGNSELGKPRSASLTILEIGDETLEVFDSEISGDQAEDFRIISGAAPFSIPDGSPPHTLFIQCLSNNEVSGDRTATLSLTTNDPDFSTATYSLICTTEDVAIIEGEIHANGENNGEKKNILSIDAPERFKLIGRIQPATRHIDQQADIIATFHWKVFDNNFSLEVPVTIARQSPLEEEMEFTLFESTVIGLPGVFTVDLGYRFDNNKLFSQTQIITLAVNPNRTPTDIKLALLEEAVPEKSPPNTLIGTFSTVDEDNGDWFFYGFTNPAQHFKIVGNELRVGNGLSLDFESEPQHQITVRSIDASGAYMDKDFIIDVSNDDFDIFLTPQSVLEQSVNGTIVGRFVSDEPDSYVYILLDDAEDRFLLDNDLLRVAKSHLLDYETQKNHNITVQTRSLKTQEVIEKNLSIEVLNIIDMSIQIEIRDAAGNIIEPPINATDEIQINAQLIPDIKHRGLEADIVCLSTHIQDEEVVEQYILSEKWEKWDDNYLAELPIIEHLTLQNSHEVQLFQGSLEQFVGEEIRFYEEIRFDLGYRLEDTGEFVYQSEYINVDAN